MTELIPDTVPVARHRARFAPDDVVKHGVHPTGSATSWSDMSSAQTMRSWSTAPSDLLMRTSSGYRPRSGRRPAHRPRPICGRSAACSAERGALAQEANKVCALAAGGTAVPRSLSRSKHRGMDPRDPVRSAARRVLLRAPLHGRLVRLYLSLGQGMSRARTAWRASFRNDDSKYCNVCLLQYIPNQIRIRVIGRDKKFFFIVNCNRYTV
jgi:hypothetical protein